MTAQVVGDEQREDVAAADVPSFVRNLSFDALPRDVVEQAQRCFLDLIGVAAAGSRTRLSTIARGYAASHLCGRGNEARMLFDGRRASSAGAAFAGATTIDAFDAHDGHVLTKGHVGVAILPALLALADLQADDAPAVDGRELLACLVLGYEIATRAGIALHASAADYHCSGAWNGLGCAAVAARVLRLTTAQTREALGVAEYFGVRGQMLRTCDFPSMVKDGSGMGAQVGVTAAWLAREGFTGAPAVTVEREEQRALWADLGVRWRIREQYFKAYPVCRWAQPAVEAVLGLQRAHRFDAADIAEIAIESFREAVDLGAGCAWPATTEDAQYSLPYAVAAALVFGRLGAEEVHEAAVAHPRVRRLLEAMTLREDDEFSTLFPAERWARASIRLKDGRLLRSEPARARGNPENPLGDEELRVKYHDLAVPVLGTPRAQRIERLVGELPRAPSLSPLLDAVLSGV
jgi:2-methylcitrate dehydratase PrpD